MEKYKELTKCLCCGSQELSLVLDLRDQPPANSYHDNTVVLETYPLKLNVCIKCFHAQLSHVVDPDLLFKNYLYVSGTTKTLRDYFDWFSQMAMTDNPDALDVLDIACNDGSQLDSFKKLKLNTYGVDPAENLHKLSSKNHKILCDYFNLYSISNLPLYKYDIITAQNVFAHNSDPVEFLLACKELMHDKTTLYIQTSQANMFKNNEFDTIYHEHISFFNTNSMKTILKRVGLHLIDVIKTPIHGTSYVFKIKKTPLYLHTSVGTMLNEEQFLRNIEFYKDYRDNCNKICIELKEVIDTLGKDRVLVGYGAAAKGTVLLNYANIKLDLIVDDNPGKVGLFMPGVNTKIFSPDYLSVIKDKNDLAIIPLSWNFFDEIKTKVKTRVHKPIPFIRYFPKVSVYYE